MKRQEDLITELALAWILAISTSCIWFHTRIAVLEAQVGIQSSVSKTDRKDKSARYASFELLDVAERFKIFFQRR